MTDEPMMTLNDGRQMPQLGFGVWRVPEDEAAAVVGQALAAGYRLVDTAMIYGNEEGVGAALARLRAAARRGLRDDQALERRPGLRFDAARLRGEPAAGSGSRRSTST